MIPMELTECHQIIIPSYLAVKHGKIRYNYPCIQITDTGRDAAKPGAISQSSLLFTFGLGARPVCLSTKSTLRQVRAQTRASVLRRCFIIYTYTGTRRSTRRGKHNYANDQLRRLKLQSANFVAESC